MSEFKTELCFKPITDDKYELLVDLVYQSNYLGFTVTVPKGFHTDLASVPRIPIIFEMWGNRAHYESVVHDWLYCIDSEPVVMQKQADAVFKEAMIVRHKPCKIYQPMYLGVCWFGWTRFHKKHIFKE